jgi:hypothetical protein
MKVLLDALTLLAIGLMLAGVATLALRWPFTNMAEGELRCESGGAVVVKIAGKDYAVNGMASTRYPPMQQIWGSPEAPFQGHQFPRPYVPPSFASKLS